MSYDNIIKKVKEEIISARSKHRKYNSAHEGLGVILEEFEEMKAEIFIKESKRDLSKLRKEAIQVAACAIMIAEDCCNE